MTCRFDFIDFAKLAATEQNVTFFRFYYAPWRDSNLALEAREARRGEASVGQGGACNADAASIED
jgi:hypothetical protein